MAEKYSFIFSKNKLKKESTMKKGKKNGVYTKRISKSPNLTTKANVLQIRNVHLTVRIAVDVGVMW